MKRNFPSTLEGLAACQAFLAEVCVDPKPQIITDEIVSNIVRCSGSPDFDVEIVEGEGELRLIFSDRGSPFDPTKTDDPDITASAEERGIGGLGLFMVRKMSKSVVYGRRDDENVLTVVIAR